MKMVKMAVKQIEILCPQVSIVTIFIYVHSYQLGSLVLKMEKCKRLTNCDLTGDQEVVGSNPYGVAFSF